MKNTKNSGQSLVEFAVTIPLLLLLIMGVFDLGRGIYYYSAIHNAAREGARYGATNQCDEVGIKNAAKLTAIGLADDLVINQTKYFVGENADRIVVTVAYDFETITPLVGIFLGDGGKIQLVSEARQIVEQNTTCP